MLEWVLTSAALVLAALALRELCASRLSCRARYALWLPVLARLLIPAQLFTASWGVQPPPLPERVTQRSIYVLPVAHTETGAEAGDPYVGDSFGYSKPDAHGGGYTKYAEKWSVADVLRAVWLMGAVTLAAVLLASNLRFARWLRRVRVPVEADADGLRVYVAEGLTSPCLVGVLRPAVYLTPEALRDERTLRHVLAHEVTHRRHGDCLWSLLRLAALCLHWFDPLVWRAVVVSKRDGELACDEATLERLGEGERTDYGETLLRMVRAKPNTRELLSLSTSMTAGKQSMRARIETIAKQPRTHALALALALAVLLGATLFAFSRASESAATEPQNTAESVPVTLTSGEAEQPPETVDLSLGGENRVTARRWDGDGWYVYVPVEGWRDASGVGNMRFVSKYDTGSTLLIREASQEERQAERPQLAPGQAERWVDAPDGRIWLVWTQYDPKLLIHSDLRGLEPAVLAAMADSFRVVGEVPIIDENLRALFTGIDPADTRLRFYERDKLQGSANGASALMAADYLATLSEIEWEAAEPMDGTTRAQDWRIELTAPNWRLTSYQEARKLCLETDVGTLWLAAREIPDRQYAWLPYAKLTDWYLDARTAEQHRGSGTPLTPDELKTWRGVLSTIQGEELNLAACFFSSYYADVRDLDLCEFLAYCPLSETMVDETEFNALHLDWQVEDENGVRRRIRRDEMPVPVRRYRVSRINDALMQYAGVTLDDLTTDWRHDERMIYVSEYDAFYNFTSDFGPGVFDARYGVRDGDAVTLWSDSAVLKLRLTDGGWRILSHLPSEA